MKCVLFLKTLAPMTHGAENAGNEQLIARMPVNTPWGVKLVPTISGNSMRHRMFREPHADAILGNETVSKEQHRWLYNGGELAGKCPNIDTKRIAFCQQLLPHTEIIGCSLPDTIVSGKLRHGIAWIVSLETQETIRFDVPNDWIDAGIIFPPAHEYIRSYQYYRHDASKNIEIEGDDNGYKGMPHGGEHVIAGAGFVCTLHADGLSELGQSALLWGIEQWAAGGATLGGQSSRGHGKVKPYLWTDSEVTSDMYRQHLIDNRDAMLDFVRSLYAKGGK